MKKIFQTSLILFGFVLFSISLFAQNSLCSSLIDESTDNRDCQFSGGYGYSSFYTIYKKVTKQGKVIFELEKAYIDDRPQNSDIKYFFTLEKSTNRVYLVLDEYQTDPYLAFAYAYNNRVLIDDDGCTTQMTLDTVNPKESILHVKCNDTDYTIYQKNRGTQIKGISLKIKKGNTIRVLKGKLSSLKGDLRGIEKAVEDDVLKNLRIKEKR